MILKYVVFSDAHGNSDALLAMLEEFENADIDGYIFCGDMAGYYYEVSAVSDIVKELPNLLIVKGNHDELYCRSYENQSDKINAIKRYGHSYSYLDKQVVDYVRTLPDQISTVIDGKKILITHGSPQDSLEGRIYPDSDLIDSFYDNYDYIFLGHTHYQMIKEIESCRVINPGSIGQPRDGKGFSYCIVDFSTNVVSFNKVIIDIRPLLSEINIKDKEFLYLSEVLLRNCN